MFDRASKIRIPTTVTFYCLTLLLSTVLLSLLRVNTHSFYFGVATCLLAHAAVYLLTRERMPAWAALFILALVVPQFPPEALTPIERGALYWGILAGLLSYTLTYGAHYCLSLGRPPPDKDSFDGRRGRPDRSKRHTNELLQLLNVTSLSQAVRSVRKLQQARERQQNEAVITGSDSGESQADGLQVKLKETQEQLISLREKWEHGKRPRDNEFRQVQVKLHDAQRRVKETAEARDRAEERARSLESFQQKVAEVTQQINAVRGELRDKQAFVEQLQTQLAAVQADRDGQRSECRRLAGELAALEAEKTRTANEIGCRHGKSRQTTPDIESNRERIKQLEQIRKKQQSELEEAKKKISTLEETVSFYLRTVADVTPEVDRLDGIISRYEAAYGPPPKES